MDRSPEYTPLDAFAPERLGFSDAVTLFALMETNREMQRYVEDYRDERELNLAYRALDRYCQFMGFAQRLVPRPKTFARLK
jgi:hypothetical protein